MEQQDRTKTKKKAMISALEQTLGVVSDAVKKVGISRQTHYQWLEDDPKYKEDVNDIAEMAIDFVESKLFKRIKKGNVPSTIFYLKTKAKHRGYVERQENAVFVEQQLFDDDENDDDGTFDNDDDDV